VQFFHQTGQYSTRGEEARLPLKPQLFDAPVGLTGIGATFIGQPLFID
jgi:hypothetical protein